MTSRQRWTWLTSILALAAGFALLTAAYGVSANSKRGTAAAPAAPTYTIKNKPFRELRVAYSDALDFLDPAQSYTVEGWQAMWNVYLTLLVYERQPGARGAQLRPGLAAAMPRITRGGRVYTFTLRRGLRYSSGRAVRATDFEYSIKRLFLSESQGVGYYTGIVGAERFARTGRGDIAGITANNRRRTVTFRLTTPRADFLNALALLFAAPVPTGTPNRDISTSPLLAGIATGPYRFSAYTPNRSFVMTRNRFFKPTRHVPRGNPNRIVFDIINSDTQALQRVISRQADYNYHTVPSDRLADVQRRYGNRLRIYTPPNTYYFWMNTRAAPFNKLNMRKAVNYAIDRRALVRIYGGLARPTQQVLPPGFPGYRRLTLYPYNLARARQLVQQAGERGTAVLVWTRDRPDVRRANAYLADQLEKIGLRPTIRIVAAGQYYSVIGNQATPNRQIGWARWFPDFLHPANYFDVLLNGQRITQEGNNNFSNANNARLNRLINSLLRRPGMGGAIQAAWARADRIAMEQALWAPYVNTTFTDFFDRDIDMSCYYSHLIYHFDLIRICKR